MKFKYIGEYPDGQIEQYGVVFKAGEASDVDDEWAVRKLLGNPFFEAVGETDEAPKNKGGRPRKMVHLPDEVTDDDQNSA